MSAPGANSELELNHHAHMYRAAMAYYSMFNQLSAEREFSNPESIVALGAMMGIANAAADFANYDPEADMEMKEVEEPSKEVEKPSYADALQKLRKYLLDLEHLLAQTPGYPQNRDKTIEFVCINSFKQITTSFFPDKDPAQLEKEALEFLDSQLCRTFIIPPDEKVKDLTSTNLSRGDAKGEGQKAVTVYKPFFRRAEEYPTFSQASSIQQQSEPNQVLGDDGIEELPPHPPLDEYDDGSKNRKTCCIS